jgi:hypothetical protein
VIEDGFLHRIDARKFFSGKDGIEMVSASNFNEADSILNDPADIDGVISDIYFPLSVSEQWNQPEPIGIRVALICEEAKIPFVLNTAGYHHGRRYEWINGLCRERRWILVDACSDYEKESLSKDWAKAWKMLEAQIKGEDPYRPGKTKITGTT